MKPNRIYITGLFLSVFLSGKAQRIEELPAVFACYKTDGNLKKLKKDNEISEDEEKRFNDEIQKFTDEFVKKIDDALAQKEKDIMQV